MQLVQTTIVMRPYMLMYATLLGMTGFTAALLYGLYSWSFEWADEFNEEMWTSFKADGTMP